MRGSLRVMFLVLLLVALNCGWEGSRPYADARGATLGNGPGIGSYPFGPGRLLDPWGFVTRQCTSYAAWYLNSHGVPWAVVTRGPEGTAVLHNASSWDDGAAVAGFPVSSRPALGSIAQWDADEASPEAPSGSSSRAVTDYGTWPVEDAPHLVAGGFGHVAVVVRVLDNGSVVTVGYDGGRRALEVVHTRAPRYLYIGVGEAQPVEAPTVATPSAADDHGCGDGWRVPPPE